MARLQTLHLAHAPAELSLYAALYRDVKNAAFLRDQLLAGNTEYEYAFVDATMILSRKHVLSGVFRAMNDYLNDRLKSRNIHSEIVFCLSPNNNIGEAFRRFGISESTRNLLVLKVATSTDITFESVEAHLTSAIDGSSVPFEDAEVQAMTDLNKIRKVYKLGSSAPVRAVPKSSVQLKHDTSAPSRNESEDLEVSAIGLMALRGAT